MGRASLPALSFAVSGTLLCACVEVRPEPDFERARELVAESTGSRALFDPAAPALAPDELSTILSDGLSLAEAERLALSHNRALRAAFWEIGVAHADWTDARLFANPALSLRLPLDGTSGILEGILAVELLDLWRVPAAARGARSELDATVLRVARLAGEILAEARTAYAAAVAAVALEQVEAEHLSLAERVATAVGDLRRAGAATALEDSLASGPRVTARLDHAAARLAAADARRELARVLSLEGSVEELHLTDDCELRRALALAASAAVALAEERRLDLRALEKAVEAAEARVELERAGVLGGISAGPAVERRGRGRGGHGVAAEVGASLPLFDRNQAGVARAAFELERLREVRADARARVALQVRSALDRSRTTASAAALAAERLLPEAERALSLARASHAAGRASLFVVLDAQERLLTARRRQVTARGEAAAAVAALERALGCPLSRIPGEAGGEPSPSAAARPPAAEDAGGTP
ncbi:MAG: hypothetical protein CMJ84_02995 [Planctomycetes bacterium]|jgi:outer membrane protein TolC|nr:hypothetical protein [Planctomycetota bacterium]MDP6408032.1 TolC family protein [Planctomycetota bacterium]